VRAAERVYRAYVQVKSASELVMVVKMLWTSCGASRIPVVSPRLTQQLNDSAKSIINDQRNKRAVPATTWQE
jgi:hypothetical protein